MQPNGEIVFRLSDQQSLRDLDRAGPMRVIVFGAGFAGLSAATYAVYLSH
jgi:ribulose 1,5-bisphosphate synthetase/thiazole synthase